MGIRVRETLVVVLLTLTVTAVTSAFHVTQLTQDLALDARRQARVVAEVVAGLLGTALQQHAGEALAAGALNQHAELRELLDAQVSANPNVVFIGAFRAGGGLLASSPSTLHGVPASATGFDAALERSWIGRLLFFRSPGTLLENTLALESAGQPIAEVVVVSDTRLIRAHIDKALAGSAKIAFSAMAVSVLVAFFVVNFSRRPIRALTRQIERLRLGAAEPESITGLPIDLRELSEQLNLLSKEMRSEGLGALARKPTLENVLDHLQDAILLLDERRCVLFFNKACAHIIGRSLREVSGRELQDVLDETHPLCRAIRLATIHGKNIQRLPCTLPTENRFRESLVSVFRLDGGCADENHGTLVLAADLGSLQVFQSLVSFGARSVLFDQMTRGVVHEVRNPLNAIGLHLELLREGVASDGNGQSSRHHFDMLEQSVHTLHRVVEGFLDYVRRRELQIEDLDMAQVVRGVVAFLGPDAAARGIELSADVAPEIASIKGDESTLRQVLLNLLQNAMEAVAPGGHVRVRVNEQAASLLIEVEDDGVGIAEQDLERVFELYYTTKDRGSGIGLSLSQRLVAQHGGRLEIASRLGAGTTVRIHLPRQGPAGVAGSAVRSEPA